jgi:hypothetical protein
MKTLRIGMSLFLLSLCFVAFGQSSKTDNKKNVYFVQTTHTPDQCLNTLTGMKDKGDAFLSKFEFGCMSGKHIGYAFLEGSSEDNVKMMLPKDLQATATVLKVDKFTAQQIEDLHKEHANK